MKKVFFIIFSVAILAVIVVWKTKYEQVLNEADVYINTQKELQLAIAEKQVDSLFVHGHTDMFPIYSNCRSRYITSDFWVQTGTAFRKELWDYNYESWLPKDVSTTYHVAPENPNYFVLGEDVVEDIKTQIRVQNANNDGEDKGIRGLDQRGIWQTRWALGVKENWGGGRIVQYIIIPYAVSFRKQGFGAIEELITVDDVLDRAFDFYTNNQESGFKQNMVSDISKFSKGPYIHNEYFSLKVDSDASVDLVPTTISNDPRYAHYIYTDSYYVFIRALGQKMYKLELQEKHVDYIKERYIEEKRRIISNNGLYICTTLFLIWATLLVLLIREILKNKQTLLQRIIKQSNPRKFVKDYNENRLKSANDIYSKALTTSIDDNVGIMDLALRVESELGISLVSKKDMQLLKKLCNPKRFTKPYNAEKVDKANALYAKLKKESISCSEYVQIKKDIDELYDGTNVSPQAL